jgi:hypothetical protein
LKRPVVEVTVWTLLSLLVHMTVLLIPITTWITSGENPGLLGVVAVPAGMETCEAALVVTELVRDVSEIADVVLRDVVRVDEIEVVVVVVEPDDFGSTTSTPIIPASA